MRSEKQRAPDPVVLVSHCQDLVFSQGDGGGLWGVLRKRIKSSKGPLLLLNWKRMEVAGMAAGSGREADRKRCQQKPRGVSLSSNWTHFSWTIWGTHAVLVLMIIHGLILPSLFSSSPYLSPESQTHKSKNLLVISSFSVLWVPQALLFHLKPLSPPVLPGFHYWSHSHAFLLRLCL